MIDDADLIQVIKNSLGLDAFKVETHRIVAGTIFENPILVSDGHIVVDKLLESIDDDSTKAFITKLIMRSRPVADKERIFLDCANKIREYHLQEDIDKLAEQAEVHGSAGRIDEAKECLRQLQVLRERLEREFRKPM
jgi:hypothetical protein